MAEKPKVVLDKATVTLSAQSIATIMRALEAGPYRDVKPVIDEFNGQISAYAETLQPSADQPNPPPPGGQPNGKHRRADA